MKEPDLARGRYGSRPWQDLLRGKPVNDRWLARQLSPYGIRPRTLRIEGTQAKGYCQEDLIETVRRYVPKAEARVLLEELKPVKEGGSEAGKDEGAKG